MGGIPALTASDVGAYVLMLMAQWGTKGLQAVEDDPEVLRMVCKGQLPSARVRQKFVEVKVNGLKCLRNERLQQEWGIAHAEVVAKAGKGGDTGADTAGNSGADTPTIQEPRTKNQESTPGCKNGLPSPAAPEPPPPVAIEKPKRRTATWMNEACNDWNDVFGESTAPGGRIISGLKLIVNRYSWEVIRPAWQRYLGEKDAEFASAQDFAQKLGLWLDGRMKKRGAKLKGKALVDETRTVLTDWLKKRRDDAE